ncbi:MAG: hypothetical protein GF344_13120 [Chitinivibrionales bacterium]|nr:hypothetical protein [Chitinivibrionales bacterium]
MINREMQYVGIWLLMFAGSTIVLAASAEQVRSDHERCLRRLERIEQRLRDIETTVDRIERLDDAAGENDQRAKRFARTARNRIDYFKGRIERVRNQERRIVDDLQEIGSGKVCPDCLSSDVDLMCRLIDNLATEVRDYHAETRQEEQAARRRGEAAEVIARAERTLALIKTPRGGSNDEGTHEDLVRARKLLERARKELAAKNPDKAMEPALEAGDLISSFAPEHFTDKPLEPRLEYTKDRIAELRTRLTPGQNRPAEILLDKASEHLRNAEELVAQGEWGQATKRVRIAEKLVENAASQIGEIQ